MKKIRFSCIILLLILLSVGSIAGCQQSPASTISGKTYTNVAYNFSVKYPENWVLEEGLMGTVVAFGGPVIGEIGININILSEDLAESPGITLQEYFELNEMKYENEIEGYHKVNDYSTTISQQQAIVLTCTGIVNANTLKWSQALLLKDNTAYIITYTTPLESYDKYIDCFNLVISTFRLY
jgi:hypothetical protein